VLNRHELEIRVDACRRGRLSCRDKTHRMRRSSGERWEKTQHHRNFYFKD